MMQENRRELPVTDGTLDVGRWQTGTPGECMKDETPSNRRGVRAARACGICVAAWLVVGCAGSSTGGSATGGSGGGVGATGTGGVGTGGSATGGSASGGNVGSGNVGTGGSSTSGAAGSGGGNASGGKGGAGSAGKGGAVGSGGNSGGNAGSGGHTGSGGVSQAGASGSGTGGSSSASRCGARAGMVFCDDFEADAPGAPPAPWATEGTAGEVTIDGTNPANSGSKSVHVQPGSNDYDTFLALHGTASLPVSGGKLYLRFFIRLAQPMTAQHNTFVRADLYAAPGNGNNLLFSEDNQMIMESIGGDGQSAMSNNAYYSDGNMIGAHFDQGQWACVEILLDHNTPAIDVWVDGVEVPDLYSTAWKIDAYDYLRFGFEKYAGPASDIWYDDIAFGTQPIGCN